MHEDDDIDFREWAKEMHPCNGEDPLAPARGIMISAPRLVRS